MMNPEIIGITAGLLSCTTFLPQVIKTWKSGSSKDVSFTMFLIAGISTTLWLVYGLMIGSISVIFTNIVVLILSLLMLALMLSNRRKNKPGP